MFFLFEFLEGVTGGYLLCVGECSKGLKMKDKEENLMWKQSSLDNMHLQQKQDEQLTNFFSCHKNINKSKRDHLYFIDDFSKA